MKFTYLLCSKFNHKITRDVKYFHSVVLIDNSEHVLSAPSFFLLFLNENFTCSKEISRSLLWWLGIKFLLRILYFGDKSYIFCKLLLEKISKFNHLILFS